MQNKKFKILNRKLINFFSIIIVITFISCKSNNGVYSVFDISKPGIYSINDTILFVDYDFSKIYYKKDNKIVKTLLNVNEFIDNRKLSGYSLFQKYCYECHNINNKDDLTYMQKFDSINFKNIFLEDSISEYNLKIGDFVDFEDCYKKNHFFIFYFNKLQIKNLTVFLNQPYPKDISPSATSCTTR